MTSHQINHTSAEEKNERIVYDEKFRVDIDALLDFIFPIYLQHPLATSRLFAFGMYGPLDSDNMLRSGPKGCHQLSIWELDSICLQIEREDIMSIYLHKQQDMGLLSSAEQDELISQADAHLKKAKGKSMLPMLSKSDIRNIFEVINACFLEVSIMIHTSRICKLIHMAIFYFTICRKL